MSIIEKLIYIKYYITSSKYKYLQNWIYISIIIFTVIQCYVSCIKDNYRQSIKNKDCFVIEVNSDSIDRNMISMD